MLDRDRFVRLAGAFDWNESTLDIDWSIVDLSEEARADRGVRYLRATYPDALLHLDIDEVNIDDGKCCVLGQLWGSYVKAPEMLTQSRDWRVAHGFLSMDDDDWEPELSISALSVAWQEALHNWLGDRA